MTPRPFILTVATPIASAVPFLPHQYAETVSHDPATGRVAGMRGPSGKRTGDGPPPGAGEWARHPACVPSAGRGVAA